MRRILALMAALLVLALVGIGTVLSQSTISSQLRFVHVVPQAPAIDVFVDSQLAVTNLSYGNASSFINVPVGARSVTVQPAGEPTILWEQQITVDAELPQTLVASSATNLQFSSFDDNLTAVEALDITRLKIIHALEGAPEVDILANGSTVASGLAYDTLVGTFDIPANVYNLTVFPTGGAAEDAIFDEVPVGMVSRTENTVIVYGSPESPEVLVLTAPLAANDDDGLVRFAHMVSDAPEVDIFVNDLLIAPALGFSTTTEHITLPEGEHTVELRPTEDDTALFSETLTVEAGAAATVVANGTLDDLQVSVIADDVSSVAETEAAITVFNAIPLEASATVSLADDTVLAEEIDSGESGDAVSIEPTTQIVNFILTVDGQTVELETEPQTIYGGVYYNVFVLPGTTIAPPTLIFAPTVLAQGLDSAPGADETETVVELPPTEAPTEAEEVGAVEETAPTEVAQAEPTAAPTTAPENTASDVPIGRVVVDADANLQLRQYPDPDALSLGLAPSGSTLRVLGREGPPNADLGEVPANINEEPFTDPAELLAEDEDLDPNTTWVYFEYRTPDGGLISAWNLAQFMNITGVDGEPQRLADLFPVPQNLAGSAVNTQVSAPPQQEDRVAVRIYNLNQGVSLNVRRTPDINGEVIARLPLNTIAEFIGLGENGEWVFISYTAPEGGSVTGWVSTLYAQLLLNDEVVTPDDLFAEDLLEFTDLDVRGEITNGGVADPVSVPTEAAAVEQPVPTVDASADQFVATVVLNQGANLNLRRTPSAQAEVLAQIPSGSSVIIDGRNGNGTWLETSFEGQAGWIASDFVRITQNGATADIEEIPVTLDSAPDTAPVAAVEETSPETDEASAANCELPDYLASRIVAGTATAQVAEGLGPVPILDAPSRTANVLTTIDSLRIVDDVQDGPICGERIVWWLVSVDGIVGWIPEAEGSTYVLEPVR